MMPATKSPEGSRGGGSSSRPARGLLGCLSRPSRTKSHLLSRADGGAAATARPARAKAFIQFAARERARDGADGSTSATSTSTSVTSALKGPKISSPAGPQGSARGAKSVRPPSPSSAKRFLQAVKRTSPEREQGPSASSHRSGSIKDAASEVALLANIVKYWQTKADTSKEMSVQRMKRASWCAAARALCQATASRLVGAMPPLCTALPALSADA